MRRVILFLSFLTLVLASACSQRVPASSDNQIMDTLPPETQPATLTVKPCPSATYTVQPTSTLMPEPPPNGLLYQSSGYLWITGRVSPLDSLPAIPPTTQPWIDVSPDAGQIKLIVQAPYEEAVFDLETSESFPIDRPDNFLMCCSEWWPQRRGVLVAEGQKGPEWQGLWFGSFPVIVNYEEGMLQPITWSTASIGPFAPSPDGRFLAFEDGGSPWIFEWWKGAHPLTVETWGVDLPGRSLISHPSWSPNSSKIAWVLGFESGDQWISGVSILDLQTLTGTFLGDYDVEGLDGGRSVIEWNKDGNHISLFNFGEDRLWLLTLENEIFFSGQAKDPQWSSDGRWISFRYWSDEVSRYILRIQSITDDRFMDLPEGREALWHPLGNELLVRTDDFQSAFILNLEDMSRQSIDIPEDWRIVAWLPD